MRKFVLALALALAVAALALAPPAILRTDAAIAQEQQPGGSIYDDLKQAPLTEAQIKQYLAAQDEIQDIMSDAPKDGGDKPDPKIVARLEAAAKKHQFASYDDFDQVAGNIALVIDGIDPKTKKYIGFDVMLKQQIAGVKADPKMSPADKKEALAELNNELKAVKPVQFPANIELVLKNFDALYGASDQEKPQ